MNSIKSPKFILAAFASLATLILAILEKIDGSTAVGTMLGLAVGSGAVWGAAKKIGPVCLALFFIGILFSGSISCATTTAGEKKFDPVKVMNAACAIAPAANNLHLTICNSLTGVAKEDCLKAQQIIQASSKTLFGVASGVYGACK